MSREIALEAIGTALLEFSGVEYTPRWFEEFLLVNEDDLADAKEGRIILGCSSTPLLWVDKAMNEIDPLSRRVFRTADEDIFGEPDLLQEVILKYWDEWHEEDDRWGWSRQTVVDFFRLHTWAIIYIYVY